VTLDDELRRVAIDRVLREHEVVVVPHARDVAPRAYGLGICSGQRPFCVVMSASPSNLMLS
jgi:hypothetical protein